MSSPALVEQQGTVSVESMRMRVFVVGRVGVSDTIAVGWPGWPEWAAVGFGKLRMCGPGGRSWWQ